MKKTVKNILRVTFLLDAVIAVGFGLYSWLFPRETFGTIISIPELHSSAFLAILASLSGFYILFGLTCLIGVKSTFPINIWIGVLMLVRHFLEGVLKIGDIGKDWLIGNPYPDLIIHSAFLVLYAVAIFYTHKDNKTSSKLTA
jgi:hypothetical protein